MKTMSKKDLVEREDVLNAFCNHSEVIIHNGKPSFVVNYPNVIRSIPTIPQSMSAVEYIKQQFRMCMTQSDGVKCEGCPLSPSVTGEYCDTYEVLHPEQAVAIVEKWAREHPERSEE